MRQLRPTISLFCILLLYATAGWSAHITDRLVAGLYSEPDITGDPIKALTSGTPLQIVERKKAFSKVRLGDNTEGWVENRYITNEKPARVMLLELQAKNSDLQNQLLAAEAKLKEGSAEVTGKQAPQKRVDSEVAGLKQELSDVHSKAQTLKQQLQGAHAEAAKAEGEIEALKERLAAAAEQKKHPEEETQQQFSSNLPTLTLWYYLAIALLLMLSFIGGILFRNHRLSKRYGGFRI
ncbi:MAG: TIGR04211 family SH3 domain-containing protein [Candidatus Sedimenticola sp. (ex Thyasira tokunagai)]